MKKIKSDGRGQIIRSSKIQRKMTKGRWGDGDGSNGKIVIKSEKMKRQCEDK